MATICGTLPGMRGSAMTSVAVCACGCGKAIAGERSTRRFYSPTCRKRAERAGARHRIDSPDTAGRQDAGSRPKAVSAGGGVTLSDSRPVHCAGCYELMPKLEGPIPAPVYCAACVAVGLCDCASRPAWQVRR